MEGQASANMTRCVRTVPNATERTFVFMVVKKPNVAPAMAAASANTIFAGLAVVSAEVGRFANMVFGRVIVAPAEVAPCAPMALSDIIALNAQTASARSRDVT